METLDVLIVEVSWDSVNSLDRNRAKCAFAVAVLQWCFTDSRHVEPVIRGCLDRSLGYDWPLGSRVGRLLLQLKAHFLFSRIYLVSFNHDVRLSLDQIRLRIRRVKERLSCHKTWLSQLRNLLLLSISDRICWCASLMALADLWKSLPFYERCLRALCCQSTRVKCVLIWLSLYVYRLFKRCKSPHHVYASGWPNLKLRWNFIRICNHSLSWNIEARSLSNENIVSFICRNTCLRAAILDRFWSLKLQLFIKFYLERVLASLPWIDLELAFCQDQRVW